jgi:glycosyltransferase domain-containing protein
MSGAQRDLLENHTVVIPTFNRPKLLRRLVGYYSARAPMLNLLVLDSSAPNLSADNERALQSHGRCKYVRFPSNTPVASKLFDGLSLVRTPFVSCCADDDVVVPSGIRDALALLASKPECIAAHGLYVSFHEHRSDLRIESAYMGQSIDGNFFGSRLLQLCQNYESMFYAVFRTADLHDIFSQVKSIPTLHYQELFQSAATLIKGKSERLPRFYGARQMGAPAEPDRNRWQTFYWFSDDPPGLLSHYVGYRDVLLQFYRDYGERPGLSETDFKKVCDVSHAIYFSRGCMDSLDYFLPLLSPLCPGDTLRMVDATILDLMSPRSGTHRYVRLLVNRYLARFDLPTRAVRSFARRSRRLRKRMVDKWVARKLNNEVRQFCEKQRNCVLPSDLYWLAELPEFCAFYRDLCIYLDGGSFDRDRLTRVEALSAGPAL